MLSSCQLCLERVWPHEGGSESKCSFPDGVFDSVGWNCATANAIRDICDQDADPLDGVARQYCNDQWYATICIDDVRVDGKYLGYALWVSWYKHRGRTEEMFLMGSDDNPRVPTEAECIAIIAHYADKVTKQRST